MKRSRVILSMILIACVSDTVSSQRIWFKYAPNPVMAKGAPGQWDDYVVIPNRIILVQDTLKLWYSGSRDGSIFSIGYAWSTDNGITWTKHPNPVLTVTQAWEIDKVLWPYVIYTGSQYKMWYAGAGVGRHVGYAASPDGIVWTKYAGNPVVQQGLSAWDAGAAGWCSVLDTTGGFKMWFEGANAALTSSQIGYATAANETTWTKGDNVNPVLSPVTATWEPSHLRGPRVMMNGPVFQMWYSGGAGTRGDGVGYATSLDGITWVKDVFNPVVRPLPGSWDATYVTAGDVLFDGNMYHMWYAGSAGTFAEIGYAISPKGMEYSVSTGDSVINSTADTIRITIRVDDPTGLQFSTKFKLKSSGVAVDTVQLFDDGAHGDSLVADGVFSNTWTFPDSNTYSVDFALTLNDTLLFEMNSVAEVVTAVQQDVSLAPLEFHLSQNFPNPFNPSTKIGFALRVSGYVSLKIFDLLGREVATLVNEEMKPGSYEVTWDAAGFPRQTAGGLASGVYFYRLTTERFVETKKLLLVR